MVNFGSKVCITDQNVHLWVDPVVDGSKTSRGLVPRNYETHPVGCYQEGMRSVSLDTFDPSTWVARLKELRDGGALLSQRRRKGKNGGPIPSRDQNGKGYCWFHSGVSAHLVVRARDGFEYVDLSAYAGACVIKNFADQGGWGAQGVDFQVKRGVPSSQFWPQQSMSRSNDNQATWDNAALHKIDEGWIDLQAAQYDRKLSWAQVVTCLLSGHPVVGDYNWWGHSVCLLDLVDGSKAFEECRNEVSGKKATLQEFEAVWDMNDPVTAGMGVNIWNSWGDSWSDMGEGYLPPNKAVPDGSVAIRTVTGSVA